MRQGHVCPCAASEFLLHAVVFKCIFSPAQQSILDQVSPVRVKPHNSLNTMRVFMAFFGYLSIFCFCLLASSAKKAEF